MKKILIIEDNLEIRENTTELLEINNYKVFAAENGNAGFDLAKQHLPQLILFDMPTAGKEGMHFFTLAKKDQKVSDIPVIFFSGSLTVPGLQNSLVSGVSSFLQKPFTEEELLKSIHTVLHRE